MDTKPVTEVFPLDEGKESITQRRGWIKINIMALSLKLAVRKVPEGRCDRSLARSAWAAHSKRAVP
jgi:hypothetical protein